ncbi:DUF3307 domain-containing protein [Blastopirellula marina]|uniref:DUF3307 domain-containing protein n=1 Tax=Blastopirellula marina TaxID=124 RepID=A0A2S8GPF9_9BACT|nr:DUF3307 domain-containing protein [Blastopirellula marina]PQO46309.1 DUF3307 domain-containing protein [Blastopirellula marina]
MLPYVMLTHWIADFLCQTRWMAENKSKDLKALSAHVGVYTVVLGVLCWPLFSLLGGLAFMLVNGVLHFVVDFITSRISSYFYQQKNMHAFFATVGFDQYLHFVCLWGTFLYFRAI